MQDVKIQQAAADDRKPLSFSTSELMLAVSAVAVSMGAVRGLGAFGLMFLFLSTLSFCTWMQYRMSSYSDRPDWLSERKRRLLRDFLWGIYMPLMCLWLDPVFLSQGGYFFPLTDQQGAVSKTVTTAGVWTLPFIALQFLLLIFWLSLGRRLELVSGFFAGGLALGGIFAGFLGICILPASLLTTLVLGLGIVGYTPLFTCHSLFQRAAEAWSLGAGRPRWRIVSCLLGVLFTGTLPWGISWLWNLSR